MKTTSALLLLFAGSFGIAAQQQQRPANVPIHTWVREDLFAGYIADDMPRFERGEQKLREYLAETPGMPEASAWMASAKLYRAALAFDAGRSEEGDALVREATELLDSAVTTAPNNPGVQATAGGAVVTLANRVPARYYDSLMERARASYARLYEMQSQAVPKLPLHIKGELLAGVAETEFRTGDHERAVEVLKRIVQEMPNTPYAARAATWLEAPEKVTRDTKLVCGTCHEAGRLSAWNARQPKG